MRPLRLRIGYTSAPFWSVDAFHRQVLHETRERQETIDYLADLRNMRKVSFQGSRFAHNDTGSRRSCFRCAVFILNVFSSTVDPTTRHVCQTPDVSTLEKLSAALSSADPSPIPHHVWTEQPENITTCVALAPNRKEKSIRKALDKSSCRLWRSD
jgi:hypothetical protein